MIKIRLAIADTDEGYIKRILNFFNGNYSDKLEVYSFTQVESLFNLTKLNKIDVLLASEALGIDVKLIPERISFAYLVDSPSIETVNNKKTVCKFQKADLIYKDILSLYSENPVNAFGLKTEDQGKTNILSFYSCSGGSGSSTVAAACSYNLSKRGKRVLYLNLELFGDTSIFFNADGASNLSEVFYAVKSKKVNLALKLESAVKKDQSGVFFYDTCSAPLDILELTDEDIDTLLQELKASNLYDYIIIDSDAVLNSVIINIMNYSNSIIFVSDGSEVSNKKFKRVCQTFSIMEHQKNYVLIPKVSVVYNKFNVASSKYMKEIPEVNVVGVIGVYSNHLPLQIAQQVSNLQIFNVL